MEVHHGGFQADMTEELLNGSQVDAGLQEMGGIGVSEGVNGDVLFRDAGQLFGSSEGALDTAFGHSRGSIRRSPAVSSDSREDKPRMPMGFPMLPEDMEGSFRQGDVAVFCPFATMDMNHLSCTVDIGNLQMEAFMEA